MDNKTMKLARVNIHKNDFFGQRTFSCVGEIIHKEGAFLKVAGVVPTGERFCDYFNESEVEVLSENIVVLRIS